MYKGENHMQIGFEENPERIDLNELENVKWEDINHYDYPDYSDAFISYAELAGRPLTESELDEVNDMDLSELLMDYLN